MIPNKRALHGLTALGVALALPLTAAVSTAQAGNATQADTAQSTQGASPSGAAPSLNKPAEAQPPAASNPLQRAQERMNKEPAKQPSAGSTAESAAPTKKKEFVGLPIFTTDGQRIGRVSDVAVGTDGEVSAIRVKVGGFFGFGAKLVEIPAGSFEKSGKAVKLAMTSKQAGELPPAKETKS